jgi:tripartite-type tricarboxylate transporter receptor subunit TctC
LQRIYREIVIEKQLGPQLDLRGKAVGNSVEEFAAMVRADVAKWTRLIKEVGIRVE